MKQSTTNRVVPAFEEELDCSPIYLGKDNRDSSFWFYALKNGSARFLKYINYFYWDRGPQGSLEMSALPTEVEQELILFLKGQVEYEFAKKRINSKHETVRKNYRTPKDAAENQRNAEVRGHPDDRGAGGGATVPGGQNTRHIPEGHGGHRRFLYQSDLFADSLPNQLVIETTNKKPELVENSSVKKTIVKIAHKRSQKSAGLVEENRILPENIEVSHAINADGLELGLVGVLVPALPKKRGRPRKV